MFRLMGRRESEVDGEREREREREKERESERRIQTLHQSCLKERGDNDNKINIT